MLATATPTYSEVLDAENPFLKIARASQYPSVKSKFIPLFLESFLRIERQRAFMAEETTSLFSLIDTIAGSTSTQQPQIRDWELYMLDDARRSSSSGI